MQGTALVSNRQDRSVLKLSLGVSLAIFVVMIVVVLLSGATADAATCALSSTAPVTNWSDTTKWTACGGGYPGQTTSDTATVGLIGFTLNVDVAVPNPVSLQIAGAGVPVTINIGSLTLD